MRSISQGMQVPAQLLHYSLAASVVCETTLPTTASAESRQRLCGGDVTSTNLVDTIFSLLHLVLFYIAANAPTAAQVITSRIFTLRYMM